MGRKSSIHEKGQLDPDKIESEILANERTFLAWVRTNIAVMSLGFVIAPISVWMGEGLGTNESADTGTAPRHFRAAR
ncbi:MAG: DUF202 domain-containing protein [Chthoniobacterales bacterium]